MKKNRRFIRTWTAAAAAASLLFGGLLFSGCQSSSADTGSVRIVAGTALSGSAAYSLEEAPEEEIFLRFIRMLEDDKTPITPTTPAMRKNGALEVDLTRELRSALADVIRYAAYSSEKPSVLPEEPSGDVITITAQKSSGGTFGAWLSRELNDQKKSVLAIVEDGVPVGWYVYDNDVYKSVLNLLENRYVDRSVQLEGRYAVLRSKYDLAAIQEQRDLELGDFIQTQKGIVWYFNTGKDGQQTTSVVECFSYAGAKSAYTVSVPEKILDIQPYTGESGYDYRLITAEGIRYRSSASSKMEKLWRLPDSVELMTPSEEINGDFDVYKKSLAYAAQDGVYLADSNGENRTLVASHGVLKSIMDPEGLIGYSYYFNHPRFMMDGKRLVLSVVTPASKDRALAFAVVDTDTFAIQYYTGITAADSSAVHYVGDNLVTTIDQGKSHLLNIESGAQGSLPLPGENREDTVYYTADGNAFVYSEGPVYDSDNVPTTHTYVSLAEELEEGGTLLLWSKGEHFTPHTVTGNYFIGFLEDSRGLFPVATYYQSGSDAAQEEAPEITLPETEDGSLEGFDGEVSVIPDIDMTDVIVEGPTLDISSYPSISGDWYWPSVSGVTSDGLVEEGLLPAGTVESGIFSSSASSSGPITVPLPSSAASIPMDQRTSSNRPIMPDPPSSSSSSPYSGRLWTADTASAFTALQELRQLQQLNDMWNRSNGSSSSQTGFMDTTKWLTELYGLQSSSDLSDYQWLLENYSNLYNAWNFG